MITNGIKFKVVFLAVIFLGIFCLAQSSQAAAKPNIVVIMTDDQSQTQWDDSLSTMPKTRAFLMNEGVTFNNSFVNFPLCCPSRTTLLTGQCAHNHNILGNNDGNEGGYINFKETEDNSLAVWLQQAGYNTALIGKYLNGYGDDVPGTHVPIGWDRWRALTTVSYYNYNVSQNGVINTYGSAPEDYQTDVLTQKAINYINSRADSSQPFFLLLTPYAPHFGDNENRLPIPAPRHDGFYSTLPFTKSPSFNELDVSDKPSFIRSLPLMNALQINVTKQRFRKIRETLLAVDDMVENITNALESTGKLDNTIIIFTSDNGFFNGGHRISYGKQLNYEESIRVPLIIRGPGIPKGETRSQLVTNVDIPATIIDYSGALPGRTLDGHSLIPLLSNPNILWRNIFILQGGDKLRDDPIFYGRYRGVRTDRYLYVKHNLSLSGGGIEEELYDLSVDPDELSNEINNPAYIHVLDSLKYEFSKIKSCIGEGCWITNANIPSDITPPSVPIGVMVE